MSLEDGRGGIGFGLLSCQIILIKYYHFRITMQNIVTV